MSESKKNQSDLDDLKALRQWTPPVVMENCWPNCNIPTLLELCKKYPITIKDLITQTLLKEIEVAFTAHRVKYEATEEDPLIYL